MHITTLCDAGCTYNLTDIVSLKTQFKGVDYAAPEGGSTNAHLFVAQHPESRTGQAVAKVYCMPYTKEGVRAPPCDRRVSDVCGRLLRSAEASWRQLANLAATAL